MYDPQIDLAWKNFIDLNQRYHRSLVDSALDWQVIKIQSPRYGEVQQIVPLMLMNWKC